MFFNCTDRKDDPMKLWLDDLRHTPSSYTGCRSVNEAKALIIQCEKSGEPIEVIDCDYDLGAFEGDGGTGLDLLEWLAERETFYQIEIHSSHPYGASAMEDFIYWNWL